MTTIMIAIITALGGVFSANGLWTFLSSKKSKNCELTKMIVGLGHSRICELCEKYIVRGYITQDEYEDLVDYIYTPYKKLGGNGTAEKMVNEVEKLPIIPHNHCLLKKKGKEE